MIDFDGGGETNLDLRNLEITGITDGDDQPLTYQVSLSHPVLGECLTLTVPDGKPQVKIHYWTSPQASGLQWLTPEQTQGKRHSYLFSQGEPLHARSYLPCQDTPGVRFTFNACLTVPEALRGLMAANEHVYREIKDGLAVEMWRMTKPIPSYLFTLVIGDIASRDITNRCRVYAEPELVDAAAAEFADVGEMMVAAEKLFGMYDWGRFDLNMMPSSFPYGGMENPCFTCLTPTLVVGDRSMVNVIAHELAHSWTGNLVTNATWTDFWLNEGWTNYVEWRICEELYGRDAMMLQAALLQRELDRDFRDLAARGMHQYTALGSYVPGTLDPDDIFTRVPYCKGAQFLMKVEEAVSRERFDAFIRKYIETFRFTSITTATFLDFVAAELPGALEAVKSWRWIGGLGLPENAPKIESPLIVEVERYAETDGILASDEARGWSSNQWLLYLELVPRDGLKSEFAEELDRAFALSTKANADVRFAFLLLAIEAGYAGA
ncbi:MAG: leukotriene A4 hydrolase C-terminal domain-containing protein, partial [bacterium]|nr:leukotriene A4 hydrolase C-terminal domain-containing protein [bacterium]